MAPLTCLLYAASPGATNLGMDWTLEAAENVAKPTQNGPYQTTWGPGWASAAAWSGDRLFEARVRAVLDMEAKQRDSVKMTVTKVLTPWLLTSRRDKPHPPLKLSFFDSDKTPTLYLLTPADGSVAAQAIVLMDQLINRQRTKVAQWEEFSRIGFFLDEITNTPVPRLPRVSGRVTRPWSLHLLCRTGWFAAGRDLRSAARQSYPRHHAGRADHVRISRARRHGVRGVLER